MGFKLIKQNKEKKVVPLKKIGTYSLEDLTKSNYLFFEKKFDSNDLNNLIYLRDEHELNLSYDAIFSLYDIVTKLKSLGKNNKIIIGMKFKYYLNEVIFNPAFNDNENIVIEDLFNSYSAKDYIKFESLLYKVVEPAKDLSPFEKYIYAYNIVKNFKEYKESKRKLLSRELYDILENEYIVCVGFCELLSDLLFKLNIPNVNFGIGGKNKKDNSPWNHERLYVNIKDEKYGINGFYVSDPTWDNDLEVDYYNHLALTNKEAKLECEFTYDAYESEFEIFDALSLDEIYAKLNKLLEDGKIGDLCKRIKNLDIDYYDYLIITYDIFNTIKELGLNYYNYLNNKYDINNTDDKMIKDLSMYIYNHINNEVLGDTIMSAVEVVYRHSYGYKEEDLQDKLEEVRKINSKRQNCLFPSKIRVDSDTELDIIVLQNKFENSSKKVSKY